MAGSKARIFLSVKAPEIVIIEIKEQVAEPVKADWVERDDGLRHSIFCCAAVLGPDTFSKTFSAFSHRCRV